jgi:3-hydroxyacyl-CoA dehydrogenase/enoyl-CoA hydratase/3-hydroxybutyryl-CoA epimerase
MKDLLDVDDDRYIGPVIDVGQETFNRIADLKIPTVACINGICLGGGYELALACNYRIATSDAKIGLPEVNLGILPAWGGTTRLPALIGLVNTLQVILGGTPQAAKPALKKGMIDKLQHREYMVDTAVEMIRSNKIKQPDPKVFVNKLISTVAIKKARATVTAKTKGNYPAPYKILDVIKRSLSLSRTDSLKAEKEAFLELIRTDEMSNCLRIFFLQEKYKKAKVHDIQTKPINTTAVIGAGTMGAGIAQWLSSRGKKVYLKEVNSELIAKGLKIIGDLYVQGVHKHKFDRPAARKGISNITPVTSDNVLKDADLLIEAIVENMDVKQKVLSQLEEKVSKHTIIATNTSALSVNEMATCLKRPDRFVGIHFFNPVHKMQLVEIVRGAKTSDDTVQRAVEFVQSIGKMPIVTKDRPGFVVNRILVPYLVDACKMFDNGFDIEEIDQAIVKWGMPMGPFRLMDEIGLDVCQHVATDLYSRLDHLTGNIPCVLEDLIADGYLGKKSGEGFYKYKKGKSVKKGNNPSDEDRRIIISKLIGSMVNEAHRVLGENVVETSDDIDFAMIMGTGFAPFRGGPLQYDSTLNVNVYMV